MAELRRVYVDSCCFIDMVKTAVGKILVADREHDVWFLKRLLEAQRDGEVSAFTSTFTIAECTHGGDGEVSDKVKSEFTRLLMSGQYVRLVEMTPFIAQDARDLRWVHGVALRGADSVHVASALAMKCEEFLSSDGRLARVGSENGKLSRLGLQAKAGRDTGCLPIKYRQLDIEDGYGKN